MMEPFIVLSGVALVSTLLCALIVKIGPRDAPDGDRKTQTRAVPSAGGVAILLASALTMLVMFGPIWRSTLQVFNREGVIAYIVLIVGAGITGLIDDIMGMPSRVKMAALVSLSVFAAAQGFHVTTIYLPGIADPLAIPSLIGIIGTALWLFVMMNAVNFMDGANGIAMGSVAVMLMPLVFFFYLDGIFGGTGAYAATILAVVIAGIIGFLPWNMTGKLYVGDTGALALGAVYASAGVYAFEQFVWLPAAIALPFLIDVFLTLIWRQRAGRHLMHAHRDHAYQLFLRAGWSHWKVALLWWGFVLACIAVMVASMYLITAPGPSSFVSFVVPLVIGCALWCWQRMTLGRRLKAGGL